MSTNEINLLKDVPVINNRNDLKQWLKPLYIISEYLIDTDTYNIFLNKIFNIIKGCFDIRECREYKVKFKFYKNDKATHELELRHFGINLILWYPFIEINDIEIMNESFILDCYKDIPNINDYINEKLISQLRECHVKNTKINYAISEVLYNLRDKISGDFSLILGLNFSAPTFINLYNTSKEMRDMMEYQFPEDMQPYEIESLLDKFEKREIEIMESDPNNPIGIILRAGSGIKKKQLREFTISEGLKPTITGETLPLPIQNSTVYKGLTKPSDLYTDGMGARKSLVTNKKVMGPAGYFGRNVLLLARSLSINTTISDCGTKHLVKYEIKNKAMLKKLNGKFYKVNLEDDLMLLNGKKDTHLIGKTIYARSPATCACKDNTVCPRCVGATAIINSDISDGFAAFEAEEITKVINQNILSTKHLLTTNSEVLEFNPEFDWFFSLVCGEITPIVNCNQKYDNITDYAIYIDPESMTKIEDMDDDSLFNTVISDGTFYVRNMMNSKEKDIKITSNNHKELYVTSEAVEIMKHNKGLIPFSKLDDDTKLFEVIILNQELTKPLYDLMDLLNKENKDKINETIDSISQKFLELLIESDIPANNIAAEIIINRLVRSCDNIYERPDFTKDTIPPYDIYTVRRALTRNKSPLLSLCYQEIKKQFLSDSIYEERNGSSYIDPLFMTKIPTDNLKKYSDLMNARKITYNPKK